MNLLGLRSACWCIWITLIVVDLAPGASSSCRQIVRHITHYRGIRSQIRPDVSGIWTSSRCEARPGPKFLTRFVQIFSNQTWQADFHFYSDYQCTKPTFTLHVRGAYWLGNEAKDLKGATAAHFNFTTIHIHPHTQAEEVKIVTVMKKSCPDTLLNIKETPGIGVYSATNAAFSKRLCRTTFGISDYEFSVLKINTFKMLSSKSDLLYFGEIPTGKSRRRYSPTSYQLPLKRNNAPNCTICMVISTASAGVAPIIPKVRPRPVMLNDEWGSSSCETRPGGSFLTRYMAFQDSRSHWEGYYYYFLDPECRKLNFMIYFKGVFTSGSYNTKVRDGEDYVFTVTEAAITPHTKSFTRQLNYMSRNNECGKDGEWENGQSQDITQSKGCRLLGISLPHTEYDLLKMVTNENGERELYVGQRPTDLSSLASPDKRPTSFQVPMLKCDAFRHEFVPPTTQPTTAPTTRFPKPPVINPILAVPTLKRDGKKSPTEKDKTSKGTRGTTSNGDVLAARDENAASSLRASIIVAAVLLLITLL